MSFSPKSWRKSCIFYLEYLINHNDIPEGPKFDFLAIKPVNLSVFWAIYLTGKKKCENYKWGEKWKSWISAKRP